MRIAVLSLSGALAIAVCADETLPQTETPRWTNDSVVGLTIELVDPVRYERMTFTRDGAVPISVGQKNGPVTAPVFSWAIVSGRLCITTDGNKPYDELTLLSRDALKIIARRRSGEVVTYDIRK
jgi:hypothetical protein